MEPADENACDEVAILVEKVEPGALPPFVGLFESVHTIYNDPSESSRWM